MQPGTVVAGRFELEHLAGTGAMGAVYRARDRHTALPVALKVVRGQGTKQAERFVREARALADLHHPGIVRYVAHGATDRGELYLAMEWLDGESLASRLANGSLDLGETLLLGTKVADALGAAHARGIIHRDIKPGNLFLQDGLVDRTRLLDFGIARLGPDADITRTGAVIGSPGYMAPEQARGSGRLDSRADVFALGCVLYRCAAGRPAFGGQDLRAVLAKIVFEEPPPLRSVCPEAPRELEALVERMLAKDPARRPADGAAVHAELSRLSGAAPAAGAFTSLPPPALTTSEQRLVSVVVAARVEPADETLRDDDIDSFATTMVTTQIPTIERLQATLRPLGGSLECLADGALVATVLAEGTATDQAAQAARCALAMRQELGDVAMVLATGRAVIARHLPMGHIIDRAMQMIRGAARTARPEPRIEPIWVDEMTAALLDARFVVRGDPSRPELWGERGPAEATRTLLGKPTPCVGREREIGNLEAFLAECISEPVARVVLVTAAAGVGKSRLRYEFLRRHRQQGGAATEVWMGRGDPMSAGSPFGLIAEAVRRAMGILDGAPPDAQRRRITERVARHVRPADRPRVAHFLAEMLGVPLADSETGSTEVRAARRDPMLMSDQIARAWEDWLAAECSAHPLLLVLEDLHWGDVPTVKLIDGALRNLPDAPLMVLALARSEVHELFPDLWKERALQEIRLGGLTRSAAEKLVRQVLGDIDATTVARVVERAAGNAFYLEELIRAVAEGSGEALPDTVLAMVESRLQRLEPEARQILRAASVFGQVFWDGGVTELLGGSEPTSDVGGWLRALTARELVSRRDQSQYAGHDELVFRHALVREAAYATLTDADRTLGHRLAGEWLERVGERDAALLAEHFERGSEPSRAVSWYLRAAEHALEGNDMALALRRVERGIACGASGEIFGQLERVQAEAHTWRGETAEAEKSGVLAMLALPAASAAWYSAAARVINADGKLGHTETLVALGEELRLSEPRPGVLAEYVRALAIAVIYLLVAGRHDLADALLARIADLGERSPDKDPGVTAWMHTARASRALAAGEPASYLEQIEIVAESWEEAGDFRNACNARVNAGFAYLEIGQHERAEAALRAGLAAAERMGLHYVRLTAKHNLGLALGRLGQLDEARSVESEAVAMSRAQGDVRLEGASRHYLAMLHALAGHLESAEREARRAIEILEAAPPARAHAMSTLAYVYLAEGHAAKALEVAQEAARVIETLAGVDDGESRIRLAYAEALDAMGDREAARQAIAAAHARLLERAEKIGDPAWRRSFLERVPDNARTLTLAVAWGA